MIAFFEKFVLFYLTNGILCAIIIYYRTYVKRGAFQMSNGNKNDGFWDLGDFRGIRNRVTEQSRRSFSGDRTSAVEIGDSKDIDNDSERIDPSETVITKFVPPHSDRNLIKKHILYQYEPENPLIKSVTVFSEKENDEVFVHDNLFIRERRALLDRTTTFKEPVPFYSYAPRYSQLNKAQLHWYIWWRQNARNGNFIKTDDSYVILYAYELAATGDGEDKNAALSMLCSLLTKFTSNELGIVYKIMIRDLICDFCLIHGLRAPTDQLNGIEKQVLFGSFLPELLIDLSTNRQTCTDAVSSLSLYDYRRSKCYNDTNADTFKRGIDGAINAVLSNDDAFNSITSFTHGVYSGVTVERHPFTRMVNIVNKNVKIEIVYYEIANLKTAVTDIVRYSENKIREHLGIRNKIHVLTVNPLARAAIDAFFEDKLPARQFVDRRRRDARVDEDRTHEYDVLYDIPKVAISPERALEIERESWDTTKRLTEAFTDSQHLTDVGTDESAHIEMNATQQNNDKADTLSTENTSTSPSDDQGVYTSLRERLGDITDFVALCRAPSLLQQRKFATAHGITVDELADRINETAADIFGDIILEDSGNGYAIIEDYLFLFN